MTDQDWDMIMKVHLKSVFTTTRAAWKIMENKKYGRILNTSSPCGIYGDALRVNYSTAKLGLWAMSRSLAICGEPHNIKCNSLAPIAGTPMSESTNAPREILDKFMELKPDWIAPIVAYLVHDTCQDNGGLYETFAGYVAKQRW